MIEFRTPWENDSAPELSPRRPATDAGDDEVPKKARGRRPRSQTLATDATDLIYCEWLVTGPVAPLKRFAAGARGAGVIPWQLDFAAVEEDIFHLAVSQPPEQRGLDVHGCRLLARQFRERVEARQATAAALVGHSLACPFDLQTLLPVAPEILQLGPSHPQAIAWLRGHWGPPEGLRRVAVLPKPRPGKRLPMGHGVIGYGFFCREQPPTAALKRISAGWPELHMRLRQPAMTVGEPWIG